MGHIDHVCHVDHVCHAGHNNCNFYGYCCDCNFDIDKSS